MRVISLVQYTSSLDLVGEQLWDVSILRDAPTIVLGRGEWDEDISLEGSRTICYY